MKIEELRSQFTVYLFLDEKLLKDELKSVFASSQYQVQIFVDQQLLLHNCRESAPHVILFSTDAIPLSLSEFTKQILEINAEIQLICISASHDASEIAPYRHFNFAAFVGQGENLATRALWAIDGVCEKLAFQYQNEMLIDQVYQLQDRVTHLSQQVDQVSGQLKGQIEIAPQVIPLLQKFQRAKSREDFVHEFCQHIALKKSGANPQGLYFKYLQQHGMFIATDSLNLDLEKVKGVGCKLKIEEVNSLAEDLKIRVLPQSLDKLIGAAFKGEQIQAFPVFVGGAVEGIFVFWGAIFNEGDWAEFLLFQLTYSNAICINRVNSISQLDEVTEMYLKNIYQQKVTEELARAARIKLPFSVVRLGLDKSDELVQKIGGNQRDQLLRSIGVLIKKTSRTNDIVARTDINEISLILPHVHVAGAAQRAERLRRTIEGHSFSFIGLQITASFGVSEYPSLVSTSQEMEDSLRQSLQYVFSQGGNQVCLYKAPPQFRPDFEIKKPESNG